MKPRRWLWVLALVTLQDGVSAADGELRIQSGGNQHSVQVRGDEADEWRFQSSDDLVSWTNAPGLGAVFSGDDTALSVPMATTQGAQRFIRALHTTGLFDTNLLRTVSLTFTSSNWTTQLANARLRGSNVPCQLVLDNGVTVTNAGARYRGNTSYEMGGAKKSINLDINYADPKARVMGYRAINLNNAAGDATLIRESVYFEVMRRYAPCPHGAVAKLTINGANWGVYSMVDQLNNDLVDEWFTSHEGDRWRAPNVGGAAGGGWPGGGGGFSSGASAFSYLGATVSRYTNNYELKSDNSTNAWTRLVHAIGVLNNTPTNQLRDAVEDVFAVDRWLWFLALENVFVDDDSYWNKGADYAFYYEPESGRIHPVEHDGNEAFASAMGASATLSPVQGATSTTRPLLYKLLSIRELRQRYLAHMRTALEESFNPSSLTGIIDHYHHLTVDAIKADPKKNFTMTGYSNELRALKTYVTNRYKFLTNHAELRPLPPRILAVSGPLPEPGPADVPFITAHVQPSEADGIDSVWLYWRDKPYGRFSAAQMFDDGAHQDGAANDEWFGASTTNFPAGNKIHFYVEARSANTAKAAAFSPARAEEETWSYRVALTMATNTSVVINELMADNRRTLADPRGDFDDWIELRNLTDHELDLTGLYLTDTPANPRKWPFPAGTRIPAHGYLLVWADDHSPDLEELHANFKLDKAGEQVYLIDTDARLNAVLDFVSFPAQEADHSWGRSPSDPATWVIMPPTPGRSNSEF